MRVRVCKFHLKAAGLYTAARPAPVRRQSRCGALRAGVRAENSEHSAQRFGGAPKQLVADGKCAEELRSKIQLVKAANGNVERSGNGGGREAAHRGFFVVRNHAHPRICSSQHLFDFVERNILLELYGE